MMAVSTPVNIKGINSLDRYLDSKFNSVDSFLNDLDSVTKNLKKETDSANLKVSVG